MDDVKLTPPMEEELSNGRGDGDDVQQPCGEEQHQPEH